MFLFMALNPSCTMFSFHCSADHERDWPPCEVVFFELATNPLDVRNNISDFSLKKCFESFHGAQGVLLYHRKQAQNSPCLLDSLFRFSLT